MHHSDKESRYPRQAHDDQPIQLIFTEGRAELKPASDIFVVNGALGNDCGISQLVDLMGSHGTLFYKSATGGNNAAPSGLIARDDTIIIKVNSILPYFNQIL